MFISHFLSKGVYHEGERLARKEIAQENLHLNELILLHDLLVQFSCYFRKRTGIEP